MASWAAPRALAALGEVEFVLGTPTGNSNWKIEPLDAPADAQIRPAWLSMIERQMESPIPVPRAFVVNRGLKMRSILDGSIPLPVSSIETCTVSCSVTSDF